MAASPSLPRRLLVAAFLLAASTCGYAGIFGPTNIPIPQWGLDAAKTKTPDYAKDAAAVILFDEYTETVDAQGRAVERERWAMRILQPNGRKYAPCTLNFDIDQKVNYFHAWTITGDDKQFQARDTDFRVEGDTGDPILMGTIKTQVLRPPAADPGATVICETEETLQSWRQEKIWDVQYSIPVVYEALEADLPQGMPHLATWHRMDPVKPTEVSPNHWRWEIRDMQKLDLRDVKATPEWSALAARGSVQWGPTAVEGVDNEWQAMGNWVTNLEAHRPDPSPEITAQTQSLIAGAPDFYTKLSRITEYIQKNIRYFIVVRGIGGYQAHPAADIFRNRYGDCKDKTTILISMLQVAGIQAFYVPVDDRRGVVDPNAPSMAGDHMITAIEIPAGVDDKHLQAIAKAKNGKRYLIFDPTNERTPVGNLPYYEQGGFGLLSAGAESQIIAFPVLPPEANGTEQVGKFTLQPDGSITGSVDTSHTGPDGAYLREMIKYTDEKERHDYWEKIVSHDLHGVTIDAFNFIEPSDLSKPLEFHYKVTAPQYAHQAGPLLLVRPRVVGDEAVPFDDKPRTLPIELEASGRWHDSFDITLPAGYVVDETPDPVDLKMDFAEYHSSVKAKDSVLHYERELVVRQVELPASRAEDFRKFEATISSDQLGNAVLKKQ